MWMCFENTIQYNTQVPPSSNSATKSVCVQPKLSSSVCRAADSVCDLPEYCDGLHHDCPDDAYLQDGSDCLLGQVRQVTWWRVTWMGGWTNERMIEWVWEWMSEWMNGWMNEWMWEWMNECGNEWTSASARSIWPLFTFQTRPSLGLSPQNGRRPVRDRPNRRAKFHAHRYSPGW